MTNAMITHPTVELRSAGQSPWLDQISRKLISSGRLKELIETFGLLGVTSNPSIFEKAINQKGGGYEADIQKMLRAGKSTFEVYDTLTVAEIRTACDLFAKVYAESKGEHGYVSLEVMPALSHDVRGTVQEAKRLFAAVNRPNVMIKVPATSEGILAIRQLIGCGININATLIFTAAHYRDVANAYLDGLQDLVKSGGKPESVRSVASVFVSRFDALIDKKIEALIKPGMDPFSHEQVSGLRGKSAIANSKIIFQEFQKIFTSKKFALLKSRGANSQKLLWGSTSTKNPAYPELMYVEPLIGRDTVNTIPMETLEAFIDHGHVHADSIEENVDEAYETSARLKALGIDLQEIGEFLQKQGVAAFCDSFDLLMKSIESVRSITGKKDAQSGESSVTYSSGADRIRKTAEIFTSKLEKLNFAERFLAKDATLWSKDVAHQTVINNRLGWLRVHDWMLGQIYLLERLSDEMQECKIKDIVLLGMGGSSLAPEVISLISAKKRPSPRFHVVDTTDPGTVLAVEAAIDIASTIFIVASKSGGTIETLSQYHYFSAAVRKYYARKKTDKPSIGTHFIAITDKGSNLEKLARENAFRHIFINRSDIGGRYSALSFFGMVPAALMRVDFRSLTTGAAQMFRQFQKEKVLRKSSSVYLGIYLAALAKSGNDKLTFVMSRTLQPFGSWLEQLIAESTGKEGKGILPVTDETLADPSVYAQDRAFVVMRLKSETDKTLDGKISALKKAGFSVIEFEWPSAAALGGEFLRWQIATSVASALLCVNPFDEPNVKEAKDNTAVVLKGLLMKGQLQGLQSFRTTKSKIAFKPFFAKLRKGGYLAILVYGPRTPEMIRSFNSIRSLLRNSLKVPVVVGFGPRYLHSIGQLYKGGPSKGAFIECLIQSTKDAAIPGAGYRFAQLLRAQAIGDLKSLQRKKLPVLTVDLERGDEKIFNCFERQFAAALISKNKVK